jgi:hypothetical protein
MSILIRPRELPNDPDHVTTASWDPSGLQATGPQGGATNARFDPDGISTIQPPFPR